MESRRRRVRMLTQNYDLTILACVELGLGKGGPENEGGKRVSDSHAGLSYGGRESAFVCASPDTRIMRTW
jgi:hypothetical protein